jgi:hypothetical protein
MPGWTAKLGVGPRQLGFTQVCSSPIFSISDFLFLFSSYFAVFTF